MLDTLLELPFALNRHRDAPLLEERLAFLKYLQERGTSRAALRNMSGQLLHVIDLLKLETLRDVSVDEVKGAARRWGEQQRTNASQRYLKFDPAGRPSDDLVVWTRTREGDRWRLSQGCLAACFSLYTTVLTGW